MRWTDNDIALLRKLRANGVSPKEIQRRMEITRGAYKGACHRYNIHAPPGKPLELAEDHPAVVAGRPLFDHKRSRNGQLLMPGDHTAKLGRKVTRGRWKGMPIFSLTLPERATCPRDCLHWRDCYGNHMPLAIRHPPDEALIKGLERELEQLVKKHSRIVVRLHVLGDFYSKDYVEFWHRMLIHHRGLHIFGFTARSVDDEIGRAIEYMNDNTDRCWIRYSDEDPVLVPFLRTGNDGVICPAQTGRTLSCGTCGLCWTMEKPIRFLVH